MSESPQHCPHALALFCGLGAFLMLDLLAQKGVLVGALKSTEWAVFESLGRTIALALTVRVMALKLHSDPGSNRAERS